MSERACANHPRRAASTTCATCGQPLCGDCVVHTGVGFKCAGCTGAKTAAGNPAARTRSARRLRRPGAVGVAVIVGVAILLAAIAFAVVRPGSPMSTAGGAADASGDGGGPGEVDVSFPGGEGDVTLAGTLTVPADHEQHQAPGVVIVPDFGGTDRDGVTGSPGDPVYRDLAQQLARQGMVVLRYDKRGVGGSDASPEGEPLTFAHRVQDAAAALAYLSGRAEVDGDRVALVGHGVGGIAGMRVADRSQSPDLSGLVLVGTAGRPYVEVITEAYRDVGDEAHDEVARQIERAADELQATGELPDIPDDLGMGIQRILREERAAYLRGLFAARPTEDAAQVTSPVLIVHGERDPDINRDTDVAPLRAALTEAARVDVIVRPETGHTLNLVGDEPDGGMGSQAQPVNRDEQALREISQWLQARFEQG